MQWARRGQVTLLAGNVPGSNIFNSLGGDGLVALVGPGVLADAGLTVVAAGLMVAVVMLSWAFLAGRPARSGLRRRPSVHEGLTPWHG